MTASTNRRVPQVLIALLPPIGEDHWHRQAVADSLRAAGLTVEVVPDVDPAAFGAELDASDAWISSCALRLSKVEPELPRVLVAYREAARWIAAVGFAARSAHNSVVAYVLVDGDMPKPGLHDWPDAPVAYIGERESSLARLRGWEVLPGQDLASDIAEVARGSV